MVINNIQFRRIPDIITLIVFYTMLASGGASMTLGMNYWLELLAAVICFIYFSSKNAIKPTTATAIASVMLLSCCVYTMHGGSIPGYMSKVMQVSLAVVLLNLKNGWRIELFNTISKWFAVLLALSIFTWLVHFVIPLPHITTSSYVFWSSSKMVSNNYIFFRESMFYESGADTMLRFQGMFLEPGHLGTIVACFLVANRFNFKKFENKVYLVTILLSVSASAYFLTAFGYALFKYSENGSRKLLAFTFMLTILIGFFSVYNGGDNIVNNMILGKLTREEGAIQGRVSLEIMAMYEDMWSSGRDLIFGKTAFLDSEYLGAGIILYFVEHGIVGTTLLVIAFLSIYLSCKSRYGLYVLFFYYVMFLQRTYPDWDAFLFPLILGLPFFVQEARKKALMAKPVSI